MTLILLTMRTGKNLSQNPSVLNPTDEAFSKEKMEKVRNTPELIVKMKLIIMMIGVKLRNVLQELQIHYCKTPT